MGGISVYQWQLAIGTAFLGAYLAMLLWARKVFIAKMNQRWTKAQERAFRVTLPSMAALAPHPWAADATLLNLEAMWDDDPSRPDPSPHASGPANAKRRRHVPALTGSDHLANWVMLHEAKLQAAWLLLPNDQLWARLERIMGQVDELSTERAEQWRRRHAELVCAKDTTPPAQVRAFLVELLSEVYNARDGKYSQLSSLYNKAFWLTVTALLPLFVLLVLGYGVILMAGAIGGLISRLQKLVFAPGLPTAYGASWVPLFCAPLLGALAAWGGLHLLTTLQALEIINLTALIPGPDALTAMRPEAPLIGVAVLLGLSERLLNQFGEQADKVLAPDNGSAKPATGPVAPGGATAPNQSPQTSNQSGNQGTFATSNGNGHGPSTGFAASEPLVVGAAATTATATTGNGNGNGNGNGHSSGAAPAPSLGD